MRADEDSYHMALNQRQSVCIAFEQVVSAAASQCSYLTVYRFVHTYSKTTRRSEMYKDYYSKPS